MSEQKKAMDVLSDLNIKIDYLSKQVQDLELNIRLISTKLGIMNPDPFQPIAAPMVAAKDGPVKVVGAIAKATVTAPEGPGQVVVQQTILSADEKPVRLARVDIFDSTKQHLRKIYTSHVGKWTTRLNPGQYIIKLSKGAKDCEYTVSVVGDEAVTELKPRIL